MASADILHSSGMELYRNLMGHVREQILAVSRDEQVDIGETRQIAQTLIDRFRDSTELLELCLSYYDAADLAVSHAVNVASYSMRMGVDMGLPDQDLEDMVVGGLLHDIGFGKVPVFHMDREKLFKFTEDPERALSDSDREMVDLHPQLGADAILKDSDQDNRVAEIILQHHEKADGSGYPRGLPDEDQRQPARIISIIDTYEALTHPRPFRDALVPPAGIEAIKEGRWGLYSPDMLRELLSSLTLFPVGHYVQLTNDAIGRVLQTYRDAPLRPDVEIIIDGNGERLKQPRLVELRNEQTFGIARALPRFKAQT